MTSSRRLASVIACLATGALVSGQQQQPPPTFRSGVETVPIYATVRANNGRLVPGLSKDDFEVRDNGVVQDVAVFSRDAVPITAVILVDVSGSQATNVAWNRDAAKAFVSALHQSDRGRVGTFGVETAISFRLTSDKAYLNRILDEEVWPGGGSPLWRAIDLAMNSLRGESGRRVILAVTDGFDNKTVLKGVPGRSSSDPLQFGGGNTTALPVPQPWESDRAGAINQDSLAERAVREDFMIYAVGRELATSSNAAWTLSGPMASIAVESGGGYRKVSRSENEAVVMTEVADELHHQYLIGFRPAVLDGKVHKLEVRMKRGGMAVRARKSYLAAR